MTIHGYFKHSKPPSPDIKDQPAPHIRAWVEFPSLESSGEVDFLLDTGSLDAGLRPKDMARLGVSHDLPGGIKVGIVGNALTDGVVRDAHVYLQDEDPDTWFKFSIQMSMTASQKSYEEQVSLPVPSVLGRNLLNQCKFTLDINSGSVTLEPYSTVPTVQNRTAVNPSAQG